MLEGREDRYRPEARSLNLHPLEGEPEPGRARGSRAPEVGGVIVAPHVWGQSPGTRGRRGRFFMESRERFVRGQPRINVADKTAGD